MKLWSCLDLDASLFDLARFWDELCSGVIAAAALSCLNFANNSSRCAFGIPRECASLYYNNCISRMADILLNYIDERLLLDHSPPYLLSRVKGVFKMGRDSTKCFPSFDGYKVFHLRKTSANFYRDINEHLIICWCKLFYLHSNRLDKLQRLQNRAARLISCKKKYDHIIDVMIKLHWLPVSSPIFFDIATQTYRCLLTCNGAPMYLFKLISRRKYQSSHLDLIVPKTNLLYSGDRLLRSLASLYR